MPGDKNPNKVRGKFARHLVSNVDFRSNKLARGKPFWFFDSTLSLIASGAKTVLQHKRSLMASSMFGLSLMPTSAYAQSIFQNLLGSDAEKSSSAVLFALLGGSISFAMLATFWLIRERNKAAIEHLNLRKRYALHKVEKERLEALINTTDQCTLIWDPETGKAESIGNLNLCDLGDENDHIEVATFAAFGKWLSPGSTMEIEAAISSLQEEGTAFDLTVQSKKGSYLETQGRTSGGFSFVRFKELDEKRRNLASLTVEHDRLLERFNVMETLFQKMPFPVWMRNLDGKLHWVNNAYGEAVEAENNQVATTENRLLFDKNEREKIIALQQEKPYFEGLLPAIVSGDRKNLQTFDVLAATGSAGMAIDRSDIEEMRAQLKETSASHAQTIDNLATAIAIFDAKKNLSFANSSFQSLWGLEQGFLDEKPSNDQVLEAMKASGKLYEIPDWTSWKAKQLEIYQSTENTDEQWHLSNGQTLRVIVNPQTQGGVSWAFENVTEQLELKSSYNALMRVQGETLDHLNEAVAVFGSDGKVRLTNPTFLKVWNFKEDFALDGKHINKFSEQCSSLLLNKDEWDNIRLGITSVSDSRDDLSGQIELLNGSIFQYHLVRLPDAQSMLTLVDMTASVNVERALKERNDALEESDGLKTRFIQHVSYELRAPLTSIAGFAEILTSNATGPLNEKQTDYLNYISQSSDVLKALIDDILDLATIDAGVMELNYAPVSIKQVIDEAIQTAAPKIDRQQLKIKVDVAKKAPDVIADPDRLTQIIDHLLSNAINASPDGGEINIAAKFDSDGVAVSVIDQGAGIPEELKDKIFERFESGKAAESRKRPGLGLSIVKSFAELHGGDVFVEDANGRGAKITCRLPLQPHTSQEAAE